jgi:hypothetical protein
MVGVGIIRTTVGTVVGADGDDKLAIDVKTAASAAVFFCVDLRLKPPQPHRGRNSSVR